MDLDRSLSCGISEGSKKMSEYEYAIEIEVEPIDDCQSVVDIIKQYCTIDIVQPDGRYILLLRIIQNNDYFSGHLIRNKYEKIIKRLARGLQFNLISITLCRWTGYGT